MRKYNYGDAVCKVEGKLEPSTDPVHYALMSVIERVGTLDVSDHDDRLVVRVYIDDKHQVEIVMTTATYELLKGITE